MAVEGFCIVCDKPLASCVCPRKLKNDDAQKTVSERLIAIRKKSHQELGGAWAKLAQK